MREVLIAKRDRDRLIRVITSKNEGQGEPQIIASRGYLEKFFSWQDAQSSLSLLIGMITKDAIISRAMLEIFENFNNDLKIEVGDNNAAARLMMFTNNDPTASFGYDIEPDYHYLQNTNLYLYFSNQLATAGSGRIVIYFN